MQMTINVPDSLPAEFLKLRIQELEQNLISEAKFFADFTVWDETKYLLSNPANAQRLLHSLAQARNGQFSEKQLIEE
jgi:PHD/YefM family antitoxin component YafN of YafNO toxin-antitoxin module